MIRLLIVDDHHAMRAGLETVLDEAAGLAVVGAAAGEHDLWPLLHRTRPDVVLMDYHLPGTDGLVLCRRIKREPPPVPRVLIYSAYVVEELAIPAFLAGADGLVHKGAPAHEVFEAIRAFAQGQHTLPLIDTAALGDAARQLGPADRPILPMMLDGALPREIAETLGISVAALEARIERIIASLRVAVPGSR
jgi:DNA-binding NarL/FixJ family response regulator